MVSVMWAHCLTIPVGLIRLAEYGLMPSCENWAIVAYEWQSQYVEKVRTDLVKAGLWDSVEHNAVCGCVSVRLHAGVPARWPAYCMPAYCLPACPPACLPACMPACMAYMRACGRGGAHVH